MNEIKYNISESTQDHIMEMTITGEITKGTINNLLDDIFTLLKLKKPKALLVDSRPLKGRLDLAETYFQVRNYPQDRPIIFTAAVDTEENYEFQSFHETTATNAGHRLKWFTDIDKARQWLMSKIS